MKKFTPYTKLSKRKQKEIDRSKRSTWGAMNPVTRKPPPPKAYNRNKTRKGSKGEYPDSAFCFLHIEFV